MIASSLFWSTVAFVLYAYGGYPLILKIITYFSNAPINKKPFTPFVTLIISVFNEDKVIAEKIENSLALDYPKERLEIMVVSDASSDRTDEIANRYAHDGVKILRIEGRVGKTACLNKAIPVAKGDIIIFSDANSLYNERSIREIASNFSDSRVGCVTGYTKYLSRESNTVVESVGVYAQLEMITKELESRVGSCVGADGAIFAMRKELYRPLKVTDINDFVIPLQIVAQGYRTVLERDAYCYEETAKDSKGEFIRQVRITNRTLRAIFNNKELLNVFHYKLFSFELFSHKLVKLLVPLFLAVMLLSNLVLAGRIFFKGVLALQVIFYSLAIFKVERDRGLLANMILTCQTFVVVNAAILKGWITYFKGDDFTTWKSSR
jgi:cellulose synthase/poly-beta-1,6-N-acetylglucosamine synthase-like glycosyltransferase